MNNSLENFHCPCDAFIHPPVLRIPAGLDRIPRQIASFPEFRRAMLAAKGSKTPLADWRARGKDDLGLMLIEMWAYVCDVLSFYDEVIAHEVYLRTAQRRPSLRKLVGLLGYIPRPAVSASVRLALFADGRRSIVLPPGMPFRSGAFDGEPPQVFELNAGSSIHPFTNSWTVGAIRPETISVENPTLLLLDPGTVNLKSDDLVLVQVNDAAGQTQVRAVKKVITIDGKDGSRYGRVDFDGSRPS